MSIIELEALSHGCGEMLFGIVLRQSVLVGAGAFLILPAVARLSERI